MKRFSILLTLVSLAVLVLAACAPATPVAPTLAPTPAPTLAPAPTATPAPTALRIPDGMGGELVLASPAQRIISLAPSNSEVLFAVGAGKQVVAREDFTNYPAEAAALPSVGGSMAKYNMEQIVALKPDLVVISPLTPAETVQAFKDLKLALLMINNPKDLAGMYANLLVAGQATGHETEAAALVDSLKAREQKILAAVAKATAQPTVFYELDGTDPAKPWTSGPGTFVDLIITLAGGKNIGVTLQGEWAQISQEELLVQNPDFILLGDSIFGMTAEQVKARTGWNALAAVQNGKVLPINDDTISRPGPRMLDGLAEMAKLLHPEIAADIP